MLTDGVEDASTAMGEDGLSFMSCLDKEERCVSISGSRTRFSKYSMSDCSNFVDVKFIQIAKTALYCAVFFLDVAKYSLKFCKRSVGSRQDFQNTPCPAVPCF